MSTLLLCHCYRIVRIAQRMRRGELQMGPAGITRTPEKKGTPRRVVEALLVRKFDDALTQQRAVETQGGHNTQPAAGEQLQPVQAVAAAESADDGAAAQAAKRGTGADAGAGNREEQVDDGETCAICLCPFEAGDDVKQLPCSHIYHPECIDAWLRRDATCPLCKQPVADEEALAEDDGSAAASDAGATVSEGSQRQPPRRASLMTIMIENALLPLNQPLSPARRERRMQRILMAQNEQQNHAHATSAAAGDTRSAAGGSGAGGSGRSSSGPSRSGSGGDVAVTIPPQAPAPGTSGRPRTAPPVQQQAVRPRAGRLPWRRWNQ